MGALLYFGGKFLAYSAWCYFGLRAFRPENSRVLGRAVLYGAIRLSLGLFFGVLIYFLSSALITALAPGLPENLIAYLCVYVPLQWIAGGGRADRLWRLGGIVISCLADIPLIVSLGGVIPVGRFLC